MALRPMLLRSKGYLSQASLSSRINPRIDYVINSSFKNKMHCKAYHSLSSSSKCRQINYHINRTFGSNKELNSTILKLSQSRSRPSLYPGTVQLSLKNFHTTSRKDAFPPLIWAFVSFSAKIAAAVSGRRYRQWLKTQPKDVRQQIIRQIMMKLLAGVCLLTGLGTFYYYSHVQETPLTGRKRFITLTRDQYLKVAEAGLQETLEEYSSGFLPPTSPYCQVVIKTARRLATANQDFPGMADQKWVIYVIDDPERNAFVLASGHIFVFTGMLNFTQNEDQFAQVLGHEMAHALLLHSAEQLSYTQFLDYFIIAAMAAIWLLLPNDGIAIVTNWFYNKVLDLSVRKPYNRTLEREADRVGLHLAAKACYDVREGSVLWDRMSMYEGVTGQGDIPEWLSTHPSHDNRVKFFNELIPKALQLRETCSCPRLPAKDPRDLAEKQRYQVHDLKTARAARANLVKVHKHPEYRPIDIVKRQ